VFFRVGYVGYVTPCRFLVVVPITSFLPSVMGLECLLFGRGTGLSHSHSGDHCVSVQCRGSLLAPAV
jgi:hypothetical protein